MKSLTTFKYYIMENICFCVEPNQSSVSTPISNQCSQATRSTSIGPFVNE